MKWLLGGVAIVVIASLIVVAVLIRAPKPGHLALRAAVTSPVIPSNLPLGVCAPTSQQLNDPNATRIDAKLVTPETLAQSDPNWSDGYHIPSSYYWVIAESGVFDFPYPRPIATAEPPFTYVLTYLKASVESSDPESVQQPCRTIQLSAGSAGPWPGWFDQMKAVVDLKVR
jgi:hypothetical protein